MLTHYIIAIIFFVTVALAFLEDYIKDGHKYAILAVYAMVFIVMATTKSVEHTADAEIYEERFYNYDDVLTELMTEPTFIYISKGIYALGGGIVALFFIYALISIPLKLWALSKMTPCIFTAMLIYIPVYFELHDMIQIRVAAAAAFLLASLIPLSNKHYFYATILMISGVLFHYSAIVYIPFLFIGNRKLNNPLKILVACLVPIGFAMYFMHLDLLSLMPSSLTEGKIDLYKATTDKGRWDDIILPYKNLYFMVKCGILYLCLYYYDSIVEKNRFAPMLINFFAASLFFMLAMATIPVISGRLSDLFGIVDCLVFTFLLYIVLPKYVARIAISLVGLYMIVFNMLFTEYFTQ